VGSLSVVISHLQYADDTLCIGEASVENLWALKGILRGFEMASGLKVNFWKSCLMGVNVSLAFLESACNFLNCRSGSIPFKYLGLPIGANPKSESTWEPLVNHLRAKLFSWRNKHISLGGRIVMLNAVLNAIPIFYLSFLKLPQKVWKKIVRIQREFLWGGVKGGKKINWLKWSVVCKDRRNGGLGVRDIRFVNLSLLTKWRWRLLSPDRALWKDVLVAKYGNHILNNVSLLPFRSSSLDSSWWKNLIALEKVISSRNWFVEAVGRKVGNGMSTPFWTTNWIGDNSLAVTFPRLFLLSNQKESLVSDVMEVVEGMRHWNFIWRRNLFMWEEELVTRLREIVESAVFSLGSDSWNWLPDSEGIFSVKSSYILLSSELLTDLVVDGDLLVALNHIWESPAPSKVIAFSWQLLYDRVPTRRNLESRGLMLVDTPWECLGCVGKVETSLHLFLHCPCAMRVWCEVFKWIGVQIVIPPSLHMLLELIRGAARNTKLRNGYMLIWHTTLWCIWKARNNSIFSTNTFLPMVIVDGVKVLSWKWSLVRLKTLPCLFYEWSWDPGDCFLR
jgi:hypothetical protein